MMVIAINTDSEDRIINHLILSRTLVDLQI